MELKDIKHSLKKDVFAWILVAATVFVGIVSIVTARLIQNERKTERSSAAADTIILNVSEDTFVTSSSPNGKRGSNSVVTVSDYYSNNIRIGFLKFDLSSLAGKTITSVKLRLVPNFAGTIDKNVKLTTSSWSEGSLTWNTRPSLSTVVGSVNTKTTVGANLDIDLSVTDIQNLIAGGQVSFAIDNQGTGNTLQFSSKEGTYGGAQLVVTYDTTTPTEPPACTIGINIATPTPTPTPTPSNLCQVDFDLDTTSVCWLDPRTVAVNYTITSLPSTGGPFYVVTDWYVASPSPGDNHYEQVGPVNVGDTGTVYAEWPGVSSGENATVEIHVGLQGYDNGGVLAPIPGCSDGMDFYWTPYVCAAPTVTTTPSPKATFTPTPTIKVNSPTPTIYIAPSPTPTYCPWWKRWWGGC